jgi:hypothetical protein
MITRRICNEQIMILDVPNKWFLSQQRGGELFCFLGMCVLALKSNPM